MPLMNTLTIRYATPADASALDRLAQLDSSTVPAEPVVAFADGQLVAAVSARDGAVIADPFVPTAETVALLRRRARQLDTTTRLRRLTLRPAL